MKLSADVDVRDAIAAVRATVGEFPDKAIVPALNRTIRTTRTAASREIAKRMGRPFTSRVVLKSLKFTTAQRLTLTATLQARGPDAISASRYNHKKTKTGMVVTIAGKQYLLPHTFKPKGGKQIFIRAANSKPQQFSDLAYQSGGRLPIARIVAPGVPAVFKDAIVLQSLEVVVRTRFPIELERTARVALRRMQ
jgi:hypothetical protein